MTAVLGPGRPFKGNERELLESTLELNRAELVAAVDGLSDAQARQQLVPSLTTPISLIKHCAAAERIWFQRTLAAMAAEYCDGQRPVATAVSTSPLPRLLQASSPSMSRPARSRGKSPRTTAWTTPPNTVWSAR